MFINPCPKIKSIRLTPYERSKLKRDLYLGRANKSCESCGKTLPWSNKGRWDKFTCAHLSHIRSRGSGGSDTRENCKIECWDCHTKKHGPRWYKFNTARRELTGAII